MIEPADRGAARRGNLALILRLLRDHGPRSRTGLAQDTTLPKATVSGLVADLIDLGLVRDGELSRAGEVGRPSQPVELDGRSVGGIGVEITADRLTVIAMDVTGAVLIDTTSPLTTTAPTSVLDTVATVLTRVRTRLRGKGIQPVGISVAAPGVVDAGSVVFAAHLGWRNVPVAALLGDRLGVAVSVENDARLAALAEHAAHRVDDMLLLTGDVGVAAGIISAGALLRGHAGLAGDVGHTPLAGSDLPCPCGRTGCWETSVGMSALLRLAPADATVDSLRAGYDNADPQVMAALGTVAASLADGVTVLADILNPALIVLGGYFAHFGDLFVPVVRERLAGRSMRADLPVCEVLASGFGFTSAARGAALSALEPVFRDPTVVREPSVR